MSTLNHVLLGHEAPSQSTLYLLSKALASCMTGVVPKTAGKLPQEVRELIEDAKFKPNKIYQNSHEILQSADAKTAEFFPLLIEMRNAPDIGATARQIGKGLGMNEETYRYWEGGGGFPEGETLLDFAPRVLKVFSDISGSAYTPKEQEKLQAIARNNQLRQQEKREDTQTMAVQARELTRRRLRNGAGVPGRA